MCVRLCITLYIGFFWTATSPPPTTHNSVHWISCLLFIWISHLAFAPYSRKRPHRNPLLFHLKQLNGHITYIITIPFNYNAYKKNSLQSINSNVLHLSLYKSIMVIKLLFLITKYFNLGDSKIYLF